MSRLDRHDRQAIARTQQHHALKFLVRVCAQLLEVMARASACFSCTSTMYQRGFFGSLSGS